jgi:hypothetical protein
VLDLLGRRWTLRLVWELREEPRRFRELQDAIGASPTIVNAGSPSCARPSWSSSIRERLPADGAGGELLRLFLPLHLGRRSGRRRLPDRRQALLSRR